MFARITTVVATLLVTVGIVAAADNCTTVCCQTAGVVSRDVVRRRPVLMHAELLGPKWLAGIKLHDDLARCYLRQLQVVLL